MTGTPLPAGPMIVTPPGKGGPASAAYLAAATAAFRDPCPITKAGQGHRLGVGAPPAGGPGGGPVKVGLARGATPPRFARAATTSATSDRFAALAILPLTAALAAPAALAADVAAAVAEVAAPVALAAAAVADVAALAADVAASV